MASPAELARALPDTLPDDFAEWDSGASTATPPPDSGGAEPTPGSGAVPEPPVQSAEPQVAAAPAGDLSRDAHASTTAKAHAGDQAFYEQLKTISTAKDRLCGPASYTQTTYRAVKEPPVPAIRSNGAATNGAHHIPAQHAPAIDAAAIREADEVLFGSFRSNSANLEVPKRPSRKSMIVTAVAVASVLIFLAIAIPLFNRARTSRTNPSVEPQSAVTDTQQVSDALKPSPSTQSTPGKQTNAAAAQTSTVAQPATDAQPDANDAEATPPPVQSQMMNDQLTAPTRIPQDIKKQPVEDAPPPSGFGAASMAGLSGNAAGVLNGPAKLKVNVEPPKVVTISAGVAIGLLVQRTAPVYPPIAKSARVSGTVVLQASITKTGAIENLHVVSGPIMLRQAAVDAVRTWRYKPYRLNNQPVEVETTVNVIFSLS